MSREDFVVQGKVAVDTTELTTGITGAALKFDLLMTAAKMAFSEIEKAFNSTVGSMVAYGDKYEKLGDITGDSTENLQRLGAAGLKTGVTFDDIAMTIRLMTMRLGDSGAAGEALRQRLEEIGVAVKDTNGNMRQASEIFIDANSRLGAMDNVYARNALAMDLYGRSWGNLAPMITDAAGAAAAFKNARPLSEEEISNAHDFGLEMDYVNAQFGKVGRTIGNEVMPAMREWMDGVLWIVSEAKPVLDFFDILGTVLTYAARGFHIIGSEAAAAWKFIHGDIAGAKQEMVDLQTYVQGTLTADALKASGYSEGKVWNGTSWESTKTAGGAMGGIGGTSGTGTGAGTSGKEAKLNTAQQTADAMAADGFTGPEIVAALQQFGYTRAEISGITNNSWYQSGSTGWDQGSVTGYWAEGVQPNMGVMGSPTKANAYQLGVAGTLYQKYYDQLTGDKWGPQMHREEIARQLAYNEAAAGYKSEAERNAAVGYNPTGNITIINYNSLTNDETLQALAEEISRKQAAKL